MYDMRTCIIFEDLCSVALKYYAIKLLTDSHTFGSNVKIT